MRATAERPVWLVVFHQYVGQIEAHMHALAGCILHPAAQLQGEQVVAPLGATASRIRRQNLAPAENPWCCFGKEPVMLSPNLALDTNQKLQPATTGRNATVK